MPREYTNKLLDMAEEGVLDWENLARDLLGWMSEADVKEFALRNDILTGDVDDDGQPSEYTEWQDYMGGDDWDHGQYDNEY